MTRADKIVGQGIQFWERDDTKVLESILRRLVSTRKENGWHYTRQFQIDSFAVEAIVSPPVAEMHRTKCIHRAIDAISRNAHFTLEAFAAALDEAVQERIREKQQTTMECTYFVPLVLNVEQDVASQRFRFLGFDWELLGRTSLCAQLGEAVPRLDASDRHVIEQIGICHCLRTCALDDSSGEGFHQHIAPGLTALRGAMELCASSGVSYIRSHAGRRGRIPPFLNVISLMANENARVFRYDGADWHPSFAVPLSRKFMTGLQRLCESLPDETEERSTERVLTDALRVYSLALEQQSYAATMLGFWQLAECLVLAPEERDTKGEVVRRLASFERDLGGEQHETLEYCLRVIKKKRNEYVHDAIESSNDDEINVLKDVCERVLWWLIKHKDQLPTVQHVADWWKYSNQPDTNPGQTRDVIAFVESTRQGMAS